MLYSQNWYPVVVNDELSISFPGLPSRRFIEDKELYLYKNTEYALMVGITKEFASESNEHERIKLNSSDSSIDSYFSDLISGKLKQNESRLDSLKEFDVKGAFGRELVYTVSQNGSNVKRFTNN